MPWQAWSNLSSSANIHVTLSDKTTAITFLPNTAAGKSSGTDKSVISGRQIECGSIYVVNRHIGIPISQLLFDMDL